MKEIKPTYVSFEIAKWLKEKGFNNETNCFYFEDGEFCQYKIRDTYGYYDEEYTVELEELYNNWNDNYLTKKNGSRCFGCSKNNNYFETYSAPEQWVVVEWALQVHKIFISVMPYDTITSAKEWTVTLFELEFGEDKEIHHLTKIGGCNSYNEAISKGIDELLKRI